MVVTNNLRHAEQGTLPPQPSPCGSAASGGWPVGAAVWGAVTWVCGTARFTARVRPGLTCMVMRVRGFLSRQRWMASTAAGLEQGGKLTCRQDSARVSVDLAACSRLQPLAAACGRVQPHAAACGRLRPLVAARSILT